MRLVEPGKPVLSTFESFVLPKVEPVLDALCQFAAEKGWCLKPLAVTEMVQSLFPQYPDLFQGKVIRFVREKETGLVRWYLSEQVEADALEFSFDGLMKIKRFFLSARVSA